MASTHKASSDSKLSLLETHQKRLEYLELWKELAIRPEQSDCHPQDFDLFFSSQDDLRVLEQRCLEVRQEMNRFIPFYKTVFDPDLIPAESSIQGAGRGLFFQPTSSASAVIRCGEVVCYYHGHIHNFQSSRHIEDKSYLMLVEGNVLVDPGPLPEIKARYINDPISTECYNCRYEPQGKLYRSAVIATRDIQPGEELFAPYGDAFWSQQPFTPAVLTRKSLTNTDT